MAKAIDAQLDGEPGIEGVVGGAYVERRHDVATVRVTPDQALGGEPGQGIERSRLVHVELVGKILHRQCMIGRIDPAQHELPRPAVDLVVAGELEATEPTPEVGQRLAVARCRRNDTTQEDRVTAAHDPLDHLALDVGERVTEQGQPQCTGAHRDVAELVATRGGELSSQLALMLTEHVDHIAARRRHRLRGRNRVVDAREHHWRVQREGGHRARGHPVLTATGRRRHHGDTTGEVSDHVPEVGGIHRLRRDAGCRLHAYLRRRVAESSLNKAQAARALTPAVKLPESRCRRL